MYLAGRYTKTCQRRNLPRDAHELTFSCYRNQNLLSKTRTCQWLVASIQAARTKHDFSLWAYVIMPNHVHLIIWPRQTEYSISRILQAIKMPVSRKALNWLRNNNPQGLDTLATGQRHRPHRFWQKGGGYDRNMTRVDTLIQAVKYIHSNPVRKGLAKAPVQWYYSSAGVWHDEGNGPLAVDKKDWPVFSQIE